VAQPRTDPGGASPGARHCRPPWTPTAMELCCPRARVSAASRSAGPHRLAASRSTLGCRHRVRPDVPSGAPASRPVLEPITTTAERSVAGASWVRVAGSSGVNGGGCASYPGPVVTVLVVVTGGRVLCGGDVAYEVGIVVELELPRRLPARPRHAAPAPPASGQA
jgi:hypothetical protein